MIAKSITMQAFGPYMQKNIIDFGVLNNDGLFLIMGNTGSGKTTILDAVCIALYGRSTAGERTFKELRNTNAPNDLPTVVEYIFCINGKKYKFKRTLFSILKKRKKEFELRSEHECFEEKDGKWNLIESSSETGVRLVAEQIIGLDCNQFSKVVMLPQGEFKNLLLSCSNDKVKIFSKLFETEKWGKITEKVKIISEEKGAEIKSSLFLKEKILSDFNITSSLQLKELKLNLCDSLKEKFDIQKSIAAQIKVTDGKIDTLKKINALREEKSLCENKLSATKVAFNESKALFEKIKLEGILLPEFEKKEKSLIAEIAILEKSHANIKNLHKLEQEKLILIQHIDKLRESQQALLVSENNMAEKIKNLENEISESEKKVANIPELYGQNEIFKNDYIKYSELEKFCEELASLELKYEEKKFDLATEETKLAVLKEKLEYFEKENLSNICSKLSESLKDDTPCPVCGAFEHPSPAFFKDLDTEKINMEISKLKLAIKNSESEISQKCSHVVGIFSKIELKQEAIIKYKKELCPKYTDFHVLQQQSKDSQLRLNEATNANKQLFPLKNKLLQLKEEYGAILDSLDSSLKEITKSENEINIINAKKNIIFSNLYGICLEETKFENIISQKKNEVLSIQRKINCIQNSINELSNNFEISKSNLNTLQKSYFEICKKLEDRLSAISNESCDSLEELGDALTALQEQNESVLQEIGRLQQSKENLSKSIFELEKVEKEIADKEDDYSKSEKLYQLLSGSNAMKTPLKMFVLGNVLDDILSRANVYFANLSHNRYSLSRKDSNISGRAYNGLDIEVFDAYLGAVRSVNTFSGGELFLASLSLAFGLSDVIQSHSGGIRIDSLFIDEGFGTLDFETLNTVVEALNAVKKSGRIVGIISHVEELKNRIHAKIEIKSNKQESFARTTVE